METSRQSFLRIRSENSSRKWLENSACAAGMQKASVWLRNPSRYSSTVICMGPRWHGPEARNVGGHNPKWGALPVGGSAKNPRSYQHEFTNFVIKSRLGIRRSRASRSPDQRVQAGSEGGCRIAGSHAGAYREHAR